VRIPSHPTFILRMLQHRLEQLATSAPVLAASFGSYLIAGRALAQTVRHFFPELNAWLDQLPDTRVPDAGTYATRFLAWWGICS
jgi:hypothetical protein